MKIIIFDGSFKTTTFINRLIEGLANEHEVFVLGFNENTKIKIAGVHYIGLGSNTSIITDSFISRPLLAVLLIFYPLVDTLRAILLRSYQKKSPFVADRIHLHHRLVDKGYEHWAASLLILCLSIFLLVLNCLLYLKLGLMLCVVMTVVSCLILYSLFFK